MRKGINNTKIESRPDFNYEWLLCSLIRFALNNSDYRDRDFVLTRIYLEAPCLTDETISILASMCEDDNNFKISINLLKELIIKKPPKQMKFLNVLLCFTGKNNLILIFLFIQIK